MGGLYLAPAFLVAFFRKIAVNESFGLRTLRWIQWGHVIFALVVLPLSLFDLIHLGDTLGPFNKIVPLFLLFLTFESSRRSFKGSNEERLFALGVLIFMIFVIHDFLVGSKILTNTRHIAHWGHLGFLLCLAVIVLNSLNQKLAERAELKKKAEVNERAAEKARGAFHDLKTQIASLGNKISNLDSVSQDTKDSMKSNLIRMRAILSLQFDETAQMASLGQKPAREVKPIASLGGTLAVVEEDLSPIAIQRGVTLDLVIPKWAYRTFVPMRASDLHRVLSNLIENSVHSAQQREPMVIVTLQQSSLGVQIGVRDFGLGFSEQALVAVERKESFTSKTEGHGRGILSARTLLATAKGSLNILSENTGALVTVEIPICEMAVWYFDVHKAQLDKILVLDDDEEMNEKLRAVLPQAEIKTFTDEITFLQVARAQPGAFLFVDFSYAGPRTGLDLISTEGLTERAVLFTGRAHFDSDLQAKALSAGIKILPKECFISVQNRKAKDIGKMMEKPQLSS